MLVLVLPLLVLMLVLMLVLVLALALALLVTHVVGRCRYDWRLLLVPACVHALG
jgi:hypothetical protein